MTKLLLTTVCFSLALLSAKAWAAKAEPLDVDIDIQNTLAKEKTKNGQRTIQNKAAGGGSSSSGGSGPASCGNIDIGNSAPAKGSGQFAKPATVIVTGPVINANNNCK